jgi:hypothetical protein
VTTVLDVEDITEDVPPPPINPAIPLTREPSRPEEPMTKCRVHNNRHLQRYFFNHLQNRKPQDFQSALPSSMDVTLLNAPSSVV